MKSPVTIAKIRTQRTDALRSALVPYLTAVAALLTLLATASPLRAETPADEARTHFDRGLALVDRGEVAAALVEFEQAYRIRPHPAVLYNLGRAYAAVGRPVDAVDSLGKYLADAPSIALERRARVEAMIRANQALIGTFSLRVSPPSARVVLDGAEVLERTKLESLRLGAGRHHLLIEAPEHVASLRELEVRGGERSSLEIVLRPNERPAVRWAQIVIRCSVPDALVTLDGASAGRTPLDLPILAPVGSHRVAIERAGYAPFTRHVVLLEGGASVDCRLSRDPATGPEFSATLTIAAQPADSSIRVDGVAFRSGVLPIGVHDLTIERSGFRPWHGRVELAPGQARRVSVALAATPEFHAEQVATARRHRTWAIISAGAGVLLAAGAATTFIVNSGRYEDWQAKASALEAELASGAAGADALQRYREVTLEAASLQRTDDIAVGLAISAGVTLGVGAVLWFLAPSAPETSTRVGRLPPLGFSW
jgi:hypothetical protein